MEILTRLMPGKQSDFVWFIPEVNSEAVGLGSHWGKKKKNMKRRKLKI